MTNYSTTIFSDRSPAEVYDAVCNVRGWWSGLYGEDIQGDTSSLAGEFTFRAGGGAHYSKQRIVEAVPGEKVVWLVTDSALSFLQKKDEWVGTKITFSIGSQGSKTSLTFTHEGLTPAIECYDACSTAWGQYVREKLQGLVN